jgi:hypothetical protein
MAAKRIQVSTDDITYYTLPGSTGELRNEAGELTDTIFGQSFDSAEPGLITGTITSNSIYKGFAGYVCKLQKGGTPVAMTNEATTLVSGKTYIITATAKQVIDVNTTISVKDGAIDHNADVQDINFLTGEITFKPAYTPSGAITITGAYVPLADIAGSRTFTLTQTAVAIDNTDIPTARTNTGYRTFQADGLKTVSMEIGGVFKTSNAFATALQNRATVYISINPDNSDLSIAKGSFKFTGRTQSGDVGALEEETITFRLNVPDNPSYASFTWTWPFTWKHSVSSKLSTAVKQVLSAWQNSTTLNVKYLHDGVAGFKGTGIVTDVSLTGGLEAMNEFTANFQLSGSPTVV